METLIIISAIHFLLLVVNRTRKIVEEDFLFSMYSKDLAMRDVEVIDYIEYYEGYKVYDDIKKMSLEEDDEKKDTMSDIVSKIEKNKKRFDDMRDNRVYKLWSVLKYKSSSVAMYALRLIKVVTMVSLFNLYTLVPVLIIMLTGVLFWGIVASVIIMVVYSISFERDVVNELTDKHGKESIEDVYVKLSIKITSIFEAIMIQSNIIIFIVINELLQ